ncbi:ABC transporter permease [Bifidobacterium sp. 64T4]|uniref:ABC transporter permease n=1 Tax=Bifidobacterium pongonis TaxID=2834432 RepID=UPI001C597B94|nr:FtsX-like permease family protein [Bifidobacterium pongonis]MBW3095329.1 ABC transporter permease [Bifidobacterium pongonis]
MFSITLKLMRKSAKMLIPAGIAIVIGTAFIACTFLFGNIMNSTLAAQRTASYGQANYVIAQNCKGKDCTETDDTGRAKTLRELNAEGISKVKGVKGLRPEAFSYMTVAKGDDSVSVIALTTSGDSALLPVKIADGTQPGEGDGIALPRSTAKQLGVKVGDHVTITDRYDSTEQAPSVNDAVVTGLTEDPSGAYNSYGGAAVVSDNVMATMNRVASFDDLTVSNILLNLDSKQTANEIGAMLPNGYGVVDRQEINRRAVESIGGSGGNVVRNFLLAFGILAMLVAGLVIANTFQVLVAQRRRTLALLRTIGAKKGQLYASVLFEASVLGLISSLVGIASGIGLIALLCRTKVMRQGGMETHVVLSWQVFVVPIAFGIIMTILASMSSARSATSVTPLEALRPLELTDAGKPGAMRVVLGAASIALGAALIGFSMWQMHVFRADSNLGMIANNGYVLVLLMAVLGCALVFLGVVVTAILWLPRLMKGVGALVSLAGPSAKIADANIQKNPRRIAATGAALLIGVTLVATVFTGAMSIKQTVSYKLDSNFSVDMSASGSSMTSRMADSVARVKGVSRSLYLPGAVEQMTDANGKSVRVLLLGVRNVDELRKVMRVDLGGVSIDDDTVLLPKLDSGNALKLRSGKVDFTSAWDESGSGFSLNPTQVDYRQISDEYAVGFVSLSHFDTKQLNVNTHMLLMKLDTQKADSKSIFENVQKALSKASGVSLSGPIAQRETWNQIIDAMLMLMVGLLAVAMVIALVGVANTLSLSVIERTKESATLRAIGMTRGQLRRSLGVEALLISLVSGVSGVIMGTLFGWFGAYVAFGIYAERMIYPFDWAASGVLLGVAAIAALLASVFPARRAVNTPPVEALAEA